MQQTIVSSHGISPSPFDWSWHFSGFSMCISQESLGRLFSTCPLSGKPEPAIQPGRLRPGGCHEKSRFTATQIVSEEAGPVCRRRRSRSKIEGVGVDDGSPHASYTPFLVQRLTRLATCRCVAPSVANSAAPSSRIVSSALRGGFIEQKPPAYPPSYVPWTESARASG